MGIILDEPKYPVVDPSPGFATTFGNCSMSDLQIIAGSTVGGMAYGCLAGKGLKGMAGPSAWVAGFVGLAGGAAIAYQNSAGRLMGLRPNAEEVAKHTPYKRPFSE